MSVIEMRVLSSPCIHVFFKSSTVIVVLSFTLVVYYNLTVVTKATREETTELVK